MFVFCIETAATLECGSILLTYNLSYSVEKYNQTSVKITSFSMRNLSTPKFFGKFYVENLTTKKRAPEDARSTLE